MRKRAKARVFSAAHHHKQKGLDRGSKIRIYDKKKEKPQRSDTWKRGIAQWAVLVGLLGAQNLHHLRVWHEQNVKGVLRRFRGGVMDLYTHERRFLTLKKKNFFASQNVSVCGVKSESS